MKNFEVGDKVCVGSNYDVGTVVKLEVEEFEHPHSNTCEYSVTGLFVDFGDRTEYIPERIALTESNVRYIAERTGHELGKIMEALNSMQGLG